jgi:hypothetical protein
VSTLPILIQYSLEIPTQINKTGEINKKDSKGERRSQIILIYTYDIHLRDPKNLTKNT